MQTKQTEESQGISSKVQKLKEQGKKCFISENYIDAIKYYKLALTDESDNAKKSVLSTNLGLCFFNLNLLEQYKQSIDKAVQTDPTYSKSKYHKIRVRILCNDFKQAQSLLVEMKKESNQQNSKQYELLSKLLKQKTIAKEIGFEKSQDWVSALSKRSFQFQYTHESLQIKQSQFGLGIFARDDIPPQKIIIAERPLVSVSGYDLNFNYSDPNFAAKKMCQKIKSLMSLSQDFSSKIKSLCSSKSLKLALNQRQQLKTLSNKQIEEIFQMNSFSMEQTLDQLKGKNKQTTGMGLFYRISFINHRCQCNCQNFFIGPWMIIRTILPIKKGDQIFISYRSQFDTSKRKMFLQNIWGIKCSCVFCGENWKKANGEVKKLEDLKSFQNKMMVIADIAFRKGFTKQVIKFVIENPNNKWIFYLLFHNENQLKGKLLATKFQCPENQKKFVEMFRLNDIPEQLKMHRMMMGMPESKK